MISDPNGHKFEYEEERFYVKKKRVPTRYQRLETLVNFTLLACFE